MPDIFVPYDTTLYTRFYTQVAGRGLIYRFAYKYADSHRNQLSRAKDHHELVEYLSKEDLYNKFLDYSEENGIKESTEEIILSKHIISTYLNAFIARFILDNMGYYPIIHEIDPNIKKSLEIFARK